MMEYTLIQNNIITSSISDGAYRVLSFLTSMCFGEKTECFPSQIYIGEHIHKSVRSIQRNINELVASGHINKRRRGSISNVYTVLCKVVAQKTESFINDMKKKKNYENKYAKKEDQWNNYPQRSYNFDTLEANLLGYTKIEDLDGSLYDQVCLRE